ncbi:hypothetical protein [Segatella copri]|uniref:hypothetical protein n=1 Tax=Segatella copri TaxID=165179 RepID=UPI00222EBBF9|nr:hypothetical protein [Segatella copri]MCW4081076.1 hypothetical protein [Segatella copri]
MKLLPCLSHYFCSPIMGLYKQWAFVILHNLDPDRVVPFLFLDALNDQVRIGRFSRWSLVKVLNIGSVAKQQIRLLQAEARKECSEAIAKDTGMMFLPMEMPSEPVCPENYLFGITLTFPNGTIVTIRKGSVKSVMHLMKLYEKEDMLCLD